MGRTEPSQPIEAFCADIARTQPASLVGSASRAGVWLMLEVVEPWRANATIDNGLPSPTQQWLNDQTAQIAHSRVIFIRQLGRNPHRTGYTLYVAVSAETDQRLYRFTLDSYSDLSTLDIGGIVEGTAHDDARSADPLTLVCTNGKRDRCCARHGAALYRALLDTGMPHVWQSTHLGGHRYAAVSAWFPEGIYLGLLDPAAAATLKHARAAGEIPLPHFRGRTFHEPVAQAADAFVRRERDLTAVNAVRIVGVTPLDASQSRITCVAGGNRLAVTVAGDVGPPTLVSCTTPATKRDVRFRLIGYRSVI